MSFPTRFFEHGEHSMRLNVLAAAAFAALAAGPAAAFEDPGALMEAIYAPYLADDFHQDTTPYFAAPIRARLGSEYQIGGWLGADPFVNGQDFDIDGLVINKPIYDGDRASIEVSFTNFGEPNLLEYALVLEADGWKIEDITTIAGGYQYRLSEAMEEGPMY